MASVAEIDGLTISSGAVTPILDTYTGASAAYSVRLLRTAYTGSCMRVREDGGNTETDIGFDGSGNLDTAAIASHCGFNNGFIRYWYDQSGNAVDAGQATEASQPQIYNGTAVITNPDNSLPVLDCTVAAGAGFSSVPISITGTMTYSMVSFIDAPAGGYTSNGSFKTVWSSTLGRLLLSGGGNTSITDSSLQLTDGSIHHFVRVTASAGTLVLNTANVQSSSNTASGASSWSINNYLGNRRTTDQVGNELQEFIVWPSDQLTTNQSGIETNINDYYSIY